MFAHAVPSSATASTSTDAISPTGPSRPSRLRGLSYLRNYTQNHLSLHSQQSPSPPTQRVNLLRSISYPDRSALNPESTASANLSNGPLPLIGDRNAPTQAGVEEASGSTVQDNTETSASDMARKRSGSSQVATQAPPTRRGQSVPAAEARNFPRIGRATSANESGSSTSAVATNGSGGDETGLTGLPQDQMPTIKFIPHQDPRSNKPSLAFTATSRTLPHEDCVIRVGRYSERDGQPNPPSHLPSAAPVGFKSKVVSRRHCEFWCSKGQWYIKDVKSSSGTFLNHIRLSQPSIESRPFPVNDGDVVQLGIDFRGGEEMIFRCVKIKVEINRGWQRSLNQFNMTTHKRIRALGKPDVKKDSDTASTTSSECAICLMSIAPCQSLFVAPCSHVWHFKCIRPMLNDHKTYPQFMCPNCRAMTDLEADVDDPLDDWDDADLDLDPATNAATTPNPFTETNHTHDTHNQTFDLTSLEEDAPQDLSAERIASLLHNDIERHLNITNLNQDSQPSTSPLVTYRSTIGASIHARRLASRPAFGVIGEGAPRSAHPSTNNSTGDLTMDMRFPEHQHAPWMEAGDGEQINGSATGSRQVTPRASGLLRTPTPPEAVRTVHDGPLTPRNDAGPFMFNGSGGRGGS
ncbi:hypothetical protein MMC30_004532 [Trapelia coarctata]|nr:hypothetical protein [Trapelia coarctata]